MTTLLNIKEELKPYFTLQTEKNSVWTDYLCEEAHYTNGGLYIHDEAPVYHKQKVNTDNFEVNENSLVWNLFMKYDDIVHNQLQKTRIFINDTELFNNNININQGILTISLPVSLNGELSLTIPSLNEESNHYQGLSYRKGIRSQELHLKTDAEFVNDTTTNKLKFTVELTNPCNGQKLECVTLYRNGNTNDSTRVIKDLTNNTTQITVNMDRGRQDVGFRVTLKPITSNNITYTGNEFKILF